MHVQRALERLGYNHNEIKVYITVLKMGEGTVAEIARKAQLPRSTTHLVVIDLQKKGLVNLCLKRKHPVWLAESPSRLLHDLHEKEESLRRLLPELQALRHEAKHKPVVKYFHGASKVTLILEEVLLTQYPIKMLGSVSEMAHFFGAEATEDFMYKLFDRPVPVQLLTSASALAADLKQKSESGQNRVRIYNDERLDKVVYIIFHTHVAIILLSAQETIGFIFEDEGLAEASTFFFSHTWDEVGG